MSDIRQFPAETEDEAIAAFIAWDFANSATSKRSYATDEDYLNALLDNFETAYVRLDEIIEGEEEDDEEEDDEEQEELEIDDEEDEIDMEPSEETAMEMEVEA